ncbi:hypothetical protein [Rhodospirillum centenum]|uniref:Uncharacterized protein n=1 Tax=Rhodospirillum centenum (strain ATCC 51521 / SW) TaxID=414684 RepID=B6IRE7_RHOCS|nr:hypothetical protein [Rhodospirillum centenum]ACI98033.1 hypothetical protein RC1_0597 [Rhodospirillum centenum SW]
MDVDGGVSGEVMWFLAMLLAVFAVAAIVIVVAQRRTRRTAVAAMPGRAADERPR